MDIVEQDIKERQEMLEKIERIKAEREALLSSEDPDAIQTFSEYVSKMNGEAVKDPQDLEVIDFYPNPEEPDDIENNTSDSTITFPEVYYVNNYYSYERERPRSAVQFVKHQLQMNCELRRSQSAKTRRNKTAPVKALPSKEFIPSDRIFNEVSPVRLARNIKTANDKIFSISRNNMGPAGDFYAPSTSRDRFELEERFEVKKLPPLKVRSKAQINRENDMNGMCVIDVE